MNLASHTRIAFRALRVNKLRSALTMLGIVIGVAAVITMVAVGAGARARVAEQIQSMGSTLILVWARSATVSGVRLGARTQPTVTEGDAWAIQREVPSVEAAAPFSSTRVLTLHRNQNWTRSCSPRHRNSSMSASGVSHRAGRSLGTSTMPPPRWP